MTRERECHRYSKCSAPLCPLVSEEELAGAIWYPGEEVCLRWWGEARPQWLKTQIKVAKALGVFPGDGEPRTELGYFSHKMLHRNIRVTRAIRGLDPDRPGERQLISWLKRHPPLRHRVVGIALKSTLQRGQVYPKKSQTTSRSSELQKAQKRTA